MTIISNERIEFNPQRDVLGETIKRNRTSHQHMVGLTQARIINSIKRERR
jgi:hypothetical protein